MAGDDRDVSTGEAPVAPAPEQQRPGSMAERVPPGLIFRWAAAGTLGVLGVLILAYAVYVVRAILVLVIIALFVAVSLDPAVRWLTRRGMRRSLAVTIILVSFVVLLGLFIWSTVPPIVNQSGKLIGDLPGYLKKLTDESRTIREVTDRYHLTQRLDSLVSSLPGKLAGGALGFLQTLLRTLASGLTVLVLTIYFMADMPRLQSGVVRLFPARRRPRIGEIVDVVVDKVGGYMIGNIIISLFAGASTYICLEIVRVPFALALAVTVALTDLIPMIGATLGAAVCVIVAAFTVSIWPRAIIVLIFFLLYQQLENYLIAPRVLRNTVDMSSVAVLLAALIGGAVLGLVGAIMAIPIAAAVKVIMSPTIAALDAPAAPDDVGTKT